MNTENAEDVEACAEGTEETKLNSPLPLRFLYILMFQRMNWKFVVTLSKKEFNSVF